ncbi:hypothetical protein WIW90_07320 [Sulfolobaceae archaeon RB850M]
MKVVYSLRIGKELREEMEKYNIKWNGEIEGFIRKRINELKKRELLEKLDELISALPETKHTSDKMVREDRDSCCRLINC